MATQKSTRRSNRKATQQMSGVAVGVCRLKDLFRDCPPAKGEIERMLREAAADQRRNVLRVPVATAKPIFDAVVDVRWFDQCPTEDLLKVCGHA
jgi:hypothetical protein